MNFVHSKVCLKSHHLVLPTKCQTMRPMTTPICHFPTTMNRSDGRHDLETLKVSCGEIVLEGDELVEELVALLVVGRLGQECERLKRGEIHFLCGTESVHADGTNLFACVPPPPVSFHLWPLSSA